MPSVSGNYMLKAVYKGDENYLGTSNVISFAIEPTADQNVFSVTSNSTITALSFDSASKELSFNVSGDPGTRGYVSVFIPKSTVNDTTGLKVLLDGNQADYNAISQDDGWLLYFTYHHSTHSVVISLASSKGSNGNGFNGAGLVGNYIVYIVIAAIGVIAAVLATGLRSWKKDFESKKTAN
jgi:hypothetical protein